MAKEKIMSPLAFSSSTPPPQPPPPSPIPTGKGSRSGADPTLSEYIDKSLTIPQLSIPSPKTFQCSKHDHEISYESLVLRDANSERACLLRSLREFGVCCLVDHGISVEELRLALSRSERIFGLMVACCKSYGDHEKLVWRRDDEDLLEKANSAIGENDYRIFREEVEKVACKLEAIAEELSKVISEESRVATILNELGESTTNIYRYHRANIIDRVSSATEELTEQVEYDSGPSVLSLHLLLEAGEFGMQSDGGSMPFKASANSIVVAMGEHFEKKMEWMSGRWKCDEYYSRGSENKVCIFFKPYLRTSTPSFSLEKLWSSSKSPPHYNNQLSLTHQFLIFFFISTILHAFYS